MNVVVLLLCCHLPLVLLLVQVGAVWQDETCKIMAALAYCFLISAALLVLVKNCLVELDAMLQHGVVRWAHDLQAEQAGMLFPWNKRACRRYCR